MTYDKHQAKNKAWDPRQVTTMSIFKFPLVRFKRRRTSKCQMGDTIIK